MSWKHFTKFRCFPIKLNSYKSKPNDKMIISLGNDIKKELSVRISHRLENLDNLPFELANKKEINDIKNLYSYSFDKINNFNGIINYNTAKLFSDQLKNIKYMHGDVSYTIKDAFKNIVINQEQIIKTNTILDDFYYKRIGIRTIIGYYNSIFDNTPYINPECNPYNIIQTCIADINLISQDYGYEYNITYNGPKNFKFTYIDSHLYYIIFEILKNSLQAGINKNINNEISINISTGKKDLIIKISDLFGGFPRQKTQKIFDYYY